MLIKATQLFALLKNIKSMTCCNTLLTDILSQLHIQTDAEFPAKISVYLALLDRWNQAYNLTAIMDPEARMIKHIADSLAVVPYLNAGQRWLDVGSGAGLPGIPLALIFPDRHWTLLDSNSKKTRFLTQVKAALGLKNVEIVHSRVESLQPVQGFDGVICRAWTQLTDMIDKTRHLYNPAGYLWAMKGVYPADELKSLPQTQAGACQYTYEVYPLKVPYLSEDRHLVRIYMESL
jgi:16S rRNA (guanine527-N7)-methyltransferase